MKGGKRELALCFIIYLRNNIHKGECAAIHRRCTYFVINQITPSSGWKHKQMFCFLWDLYASPVQWGHVCLRLQSCTLLHPWELGPRKDDLSVQNWVGKMVDMAGLGLAQCIGWCVSEERSIMCIIRAWLDFTNSAKKAGLGDVAAALSNGSKLRAQ